MAWNSIHDALEALPPVDKYDEETWEWTVGKDYWDHRASSAAYKLEMVTDAQGKCGPVCENKGKIVIYKKLCASCNIFVVVIVTTVYFCVFF